MRQPYHSFLWLCLGIAYQAEAQQPNFSPPQPASLQSIRVGATEQINQTNRQVMQMHGI